MGFYATFASSSGGDFSELTCSKQPRVETVNMHNQMRQKLTMIYWKSDKFWLGRVREFPDIMTQGQTLKELEENIRDDYQMMVLDDVPENYGLKEIMV